MTRLELFGVSDGTLRFAAGRFEPACTVVLGDDAAALATFAAVTSGGRAPAHGHVSLDGQPLVTGPAARRRVASALARETLPPAKDVASAVARILAARGARSTVAHVLDQFGLGAWGRQQPEALDRDELRSVALALALAHQAADVLVISEPLSTSSLEPALVRASVSAAVARGVTVVLVTASRAVAESFGGSRCTLTNGVLLGATGAA